MNHSEMSLGASMAYIFTMPMFGRKGFLQYRQFLNSHRRSFKASLRKFSSHSSVISLSLTRFQNLLDAAGPYTQVHSTVGNLNSIDSGVTRMTMPFSPPQLIWIQSLVRSIRLSADVRKISPFFPLPFF